MRTDLLLTNGTIRTQDATFPTAEAVAVERGKIVAVGANGASWRADAPVRG